MKKQGKDASCDTSDLGTTIKEPYAALWGTLHLVNTPLLSGLNDATWKIFADLKDSPAHNEIPVRIRDFSYLKLPEYVGQLADEAKRYFVARGTAFTAEDAKKTTGMLAGMVEGWLNSQRFLVSQYLGYKKLYPPSENANSYAPDPRTALLDQMFVRGQRKRSPLSGEAEHVITGLIDEFVKTAGTVNFLYNTSHQLTILDAAIAKEVEAIRSALVEKSEKHIETFPTPPGTRWEDIEFEEIDGETIRIRIAGKSWHRNYFRMGFEDAHRKRSNLQWKMLMTCLEKGEIGWSVDRRGSDQDTNPEKKREAVRRKKDDMTERAAPAGSAVNERKQQKTRLSKQLRAYFSLPADPFTNYKDTKSWKPKFRIARDPEEETSSSFQ